MILISCFPELSPVCEAEVLLVVPLGVQDGPDDHLAGQVHGDQREGGERGLAQ